MSRTRRYSDRRKSMAYCSTGIRRHRVAPLDRDEEDAAGEQPAERDHQPAADVVDRHDAVFF